MTKVSDKLINEFGNEIDIAVDSTVEGAVEFIEIRLLSPRSCSSNGITRKEAEKLHELLGEVLASK